jgi:glycosyltransferase involved in cell wall biosynthesis
VSRQQAGRAGVSVIIPAYNAARFIRPTLDSVLAQDVPGMEVIVVDDGSSDGTAGVAAAAGSLVSVITGPRRGVSSARNEGVRASGGAYIAFIDHDDLWEPGKLRRQAEVLDADPRVGLVFTQARVVRGEPGEDGDPAGEIFPVLPDPVSFLAKAHENLVHWNYIPMSSVMVRRSRLPPLAGTGPFDPRYTLSEDWDLWLKVAAACGDGGVAFIAEPLTRYRIVAGRATERMADLRLEDIAIFEEQLRDHAWLSSSDPERCRSTLYRLNEEAGYWLWKEGRGVEARRVLRQAWRLRRSSFKPLVYFAASMLGGRMRAASS